MKNIIKSKTVITKDEERKEADKKNNDFYLLEQCISDVADEAEEDDWELTPVEELSMNITINLAFIAADRFSEAVDGMEIESIESIIRRLKYSDCKTAVRMLQAMFLIKGYKDAALALDILMACEEYDGDVYEYFIDELFDTDVFEWFMSEMRPKQICDRSRLPACLN